jgi:hypothetical protein
MLPVRLSLLALTLRLDCSSLSSSCDHLRRADEPDGLDEDALDALLLPGREECDLDRLLDEHGPGRLDSEGAKERLSTESR